jgi:hypothetical protein
VARAAPPGKGKRAGRGAATRPRATSAPPSHHLSGAATATATLTGTLTTQILLAGTVQNADAAGYRKILAGQTRAQEVRAARRLDWHTKILAVHDDLLRQRVASGRASRRWSVRQQARKVHALLVEMAEGDARVPSIELIRKHLTDRSSLTVRA